MPSETPSVRLFLSVAHFSSALSNDKLHFQMILVQLTSFLLLLRLVHGTCITNIKLKNKREMEDFFKV